MKPAKDYGVSRSTDQDRGREGLSVHHRVLIVGAGPVGLTLALDLASQGINAVVLTANTSSCEGSRAICFAQRTLDIWHRLGVGEDLRQQGVTWKTGRIFRGEQQIHSFSLQQDTGYRMPAFINLQQYAVEETLIDRLRTETDVDLRFGHRVTRVTNGEANVSLDVETPEGSYQLTCDILVAADGARSTVRKELDLEFQGESFDDKFLIADIVMEADFPAERRFWFDPPFNPGRSALLHMQPNNVWRVDLQLSPDADPAEELQEERVRDRISAMLPGTEFELEWLSIYTFQCRRLERFRHGRTLFVGDAAHQVSPFGARGANSGIQDAENLAWKLAHVLRHGADDSLLDSYEDERIPAADENIRHSTRSTEFLTPKTASSTSLRDAVLGLARHAPFAQEMINSGRLSQPFTADGSFLSSADTSGLPHSVRPGAPCPDAPVALAGSSSWLLDHLTSRFTCLWVGPFGSRERDAIDSILQMEPELAVVLVESMEDSGEEGDSGGLLDQDVVRLVDAAGKVQERFAPASPGCYLVRPDQHVAGRWTSLDPNQVVAAVLRCRASFVAN